MSEAKSGWVVVSGAAGSIGQACVAHYASLGKILALDIVEGESACIPNVTFAAADLTSADAVDTALRQIPTSDGISLLINTVGMIWNEPVVAVKGAKMMPHDVETFRKTIDANLTAAFVISSRVAARMVRKGKGAIINFSSVSAGGIAGQVAYGAAKAGIAGMTKAMAIELSGLGVRVNAVAPGFIDVPSTHAALSKEKLDDYVSRTPNRRLGTPYELISAIDFLATNEFVNGTVLEIDGGLTLS